MRRLLQFSFLLSFTSMSIGLCHAQVRIFEVDGINYRVVKEPDGSMTMGAVSVCALEYGEYDGDIVIPNVVKENDDQYADKYKVVGIDDEAFSQAQYLKSVQLPPSIETIGERAFYMSSLESVTIPMGNLTRIGRYAFASSKIKNIEIPSTVKEICECAFRNCNFLLEVTIHEGLTLINNEAFAQCYKLETVNLPNSLRSIGDSSFDRCGKLAKVKLGTGLKRIGSRAFADCVSLETIDLPNGLREIGTEAFTYSGLVEITIPESIKVIKSSCFEKSKIKIVHLPKGLREIEAYAFAQCDYLKKIKPPSGTTVSPSAFMTSEEWRKQIEEAIIRGTEE